jgi:hypothetical protein
MKKKLAIIPTTKLADLTDKQRAFLFPPGQQIPKILEEGGVIGRMDRKARENIVEASKKLNEVVGSLFSPRNDKDFKATGAALNLIIGKLKYAKELLEECDKQEVIVKSGWPILPSEDDKQKHKPGPPPVYTRLIKKHPNKTPAEICNIEFPEAKKEKRALHRIALTQARNKEKHKKSS